MAPPRELDQRLEMHCDTLMILGRSVQSTEGAWLRTTSRLMCEQCAATLELTWVEPIRTPGDSRD